MLLRHLETLTYKPILIGTWAAATWAVAFYERNGYVCVSHEEKERLLRTYWSIPERQVETSVVLAKALTPWPPVSRLPRTAGCLERGNCGRRVRPPLALSWYLGSGQGGAPWTTQGGW